VTAPHNEPRRAFSVTLVAAILTIVGMSLDLTFWRTKMHATPHWHFVSAAASVFVIGLVFALRATGRQWIASTSFVVINAITEVAVWRASTVLALGSVGWVPFQTEKLGALTVAALAPPSPWAGALSIGLFVGSALVHFASFDPIVRARLLAEPWATLAYGVFGLLLYIYRLHALSTERKIAELRAARRAVEHVSRMLLAVRDFSNTPLQTLYLTTALLRSRRTSDSELLDRMDRSLARLRELNEIMSGYESQVGWRDGEESLDAAATLQRGFTHSPTPSPGRCVPRARNH
jgi:hypothetical protein